MNPLYASEALMQLYEQIGWKNNNQGISVILYGKLPVYLADLQQWMYETHGLWCYVEMAFGEASFFWTVESKFIAGHHGKTIAHSGIKKYDNPQSALESALLKAGEIIKEKL